MIQSWNSSRPSSDSRTLLDASFPTKVGHSCFLWAAQILLSNYLLQISPTEIAFFGMVSLDNPKTDVAWYFLVGVESRRILRNLCKWAVGTGLSLPLNSKTFTIKLNKIYFKQTFSIKLNKVSFQQTNKQTNKLNLIKEGKSKQR